MANSKTAKSSKKPAKAAPKHSGANGAKKGAAPGSKLASMLKTFMGNKPAAKKGKPAAPAKPVKAAAPAKGQSKAEAKAKVSAKAHHKEQPKVQEAAPKKKGAAPSAVPAKPVSAKAAKAAGKAGASAAAALNNLRSGGLPLEPVNEAVCREVACEGLATALGYCRLHYIKNWKKIKRKEGILKEGKLNQYIEELVAKYPEKYIEAIRQDLANDKDFAKVIYDLDLDESEDEFDVEGESVDSLIDNIKRDFEDEGDAF